MNGRRSLTAGRPFLDFKVHLLECENLTAMLNWALIFLMVAIIAGIFGFAGLAIAAAGLAKVIFFLFLTLFLLSLLTGLGRRA